jgi:PAS domain S-box-containing protein
MASPSRRPVGHQRHGRDRTGAPSSSLYASSLRLAKCSVVDMDATITSTLKELCRAEGAEQAAWFLAREDSPCVVRYMPKTTGDVLDKVRNLNRHELPWCRAQLLEGKAVLISGLAELPSQAMIDRKYLESLGLRSLALVPVENGELSSGVFAILSSRRVCLWSASLVQTCAFVGSMFLSAYKRKLTYLKTENSGGSHFREVFNNVPAGIALESTSGHMLFVNEALCRMMGFTELEMMRMTCKNFSHPADYEREMPLFSQLLSGERNSYQIEKRFLHRSGTTIWGNVSVTLLQEHSDGIVVLGIVEDITAHKDVLDKLIVSQKEAESLASRLILSQEDERRRVARELHDDIGQRLSMVTSQIHAFEAGLGKNGRTQLMSIAGLGKTLDALVSDIHDLSHRLHCTKLQHLGLAPALRGFCGEIARAGLQVEMVLDDNLEPVPKDIALCLYRVAQEALTNALKHSGASSAVLTLLKKRDGYSMAVKDAGKGFDPETFPQGLGIVSMRERVRSVHGRLSLTSYLDRGTQIIVEIPGKIIERSIKKTAP